MATDNGGDRFGAPAGGVQSLLMDVTRVVLETGRLIALTRLEIRATYGGLLEGYPCARVNDSMILAPARQSQTRFGGAPGHVIEPERSYPEPGQPPGSWGPAE